MTDYTHVRPWRNQNPGDLRTLPAPEKWFGQGGVDNAPGGPFAIFVTATDGWRALAMCLLTYQDSHHLRTVRGIANRFAPPADHNDVSAYQGVLCQYLGVGPDDVLDLHRPDTMMKMCTGISVAESGHLPWDEKPKQSGVFLALHVAVPTSQPGVAINPANQPQPTAIADDLNAKELARVQS